MHLWALFSCSLDIFIQLFRNWPCQDISFQLNELLSKVHIHVKTWIILCLQTRWGKQIEQKKKKPKTEILTDRHYSVITQHICEGYNMQLSYRSIATASIQQTILNFCGQIQKPQYTPPPLLMQTLTNVQHHWKQTKQEFGTEIVPRE